MTRPGGTTARGLPYPGSVGIHADTPKAIQALAEAVDGQLSTIGGGNAIAFWTGNVTMNSSETSPNMGQYFPALRSIAGMVVAYGTWAGGVNQIGWPTAGGAAGTFQMCSAKAAYLWPTGTAESFANKTVTVCVMAWGPPV